MRICIVDPSDLCEHGRPRVLFTPSGNATFEAEFAGLFTDHPWWRLLRRWHGRHLSVRLEETAAGLREATIRL